MSRMTFVATFGLVWCFQGVAQSQEKPSTLGEDREKLRGEWVSVVSKDKDGTERQRRLFLGSSFNNYVKVIRETKRGSDPVERIESKVFIFGKVLQKDKKRVVILREHAGGGEFTDHEIEYELSGAKVKLKGKVAGVDLSGEWTKVKEEK